VLNKFVNKKEESRNKKVVGSFETITDYDKYLLTVKLKTINNLGIFK